MNSKSFLALSLDITMLILPIKIFYTLIYLFKLCHTKLLYCIVHLEPLVLKLGSL